MFHQVVSELSDLLSADSRNMIIEQLLGLPKRAFVEEAVKGATPRILKSEQTVASNVLADHGWEALGHSPGVTELPVSDAIIKRLLPFVAHATSSIVKLGATQS